MEPMQIVTMKIKTSLYGCQILLMLTQVSTSPNHTYVTLTCMHASSQERNGDGEFDGNGKTIAMLMEVVQSAAVTAWAEPV